MNYVTPKARALIERDPQTAFDAGTDLWRVDVATFNGTVEHIVRATSERDAANLLPNTLGVRDYE